METLEHFHRNRRIVEDFTTRTLAAIPSIYSRLLYVSLLRDIANGRYHHEGLSALYPEDAVQQALLHCHQELFHRVLETPLEQQEWELRACFAALEGEFGGIVARWREMEPYRLFLPAEVPGYLGDLFCSNVRALLALFDEERATGDPTS